MRTHIKYQWLFVGLCIYISVHINLWSSNPPDVDPINFITALSNYDVSADSPHPPGYPAYVGLARLASHLVSNSHAYQAVNLLLVIVSALAIYFSLIKLNLQYAASVATVVVLSHFLVLAVTTVPESYFSDACFGSCLFYFVLHYYDKPNVLRFGVALIFFLFGLFRVVTDIFLLPLLIVSILRLNGNKKLVAQCGLMAIVALLFAWITTVEIAGGYSKYQFAVSRVMGDAVQSSSILAGAPLKNHIQMILKLLVWVAVFVMPYLVCLIFNRISPKKSKEDTNNIQIDQVILLSWILPALLFYFFIYYLKPGYLLIFLPPYAIYLSVTIAKLKATHGLWLSRTVLVFAVLINLSLYFLPNQSWPEPLYRQSHTYTVFKDNAWKNLKQQLNNSTTQQLNNSTTQPSKMLLVWGGSDSLSVYALRLIDWQGDVAVLSSDKKHVVFLNPQKMQWLDTADLLSERVSKYEKILIINQHGHDKPVIGMIDESSRVGK